MTIDITISLSDEDLGKFQQFVDRGKQAVLDPESAEAVEAAADDLIQKARMRQRRSRRRAASFAITC